MKSFSQGNTAFRYLKVPTQTGALVKRATGTADPVTADKIGDVVEWLVAKHAWALLGRVTTAKSAVTLDELYRRWMAAPGRPNPRTGKPMEPSNDERLEYVADSLNDAALDPLVKEFDLALRSGARKIGETTADNYTWSIRTFIPEGSSMTLSQLTTPALSAWLGAATTLSSATLRIRGIAMKQLIKWLRAKGLLGYDPMDGVALPRAGTPLCHHLDVHEAIALADAQTGQFRLYSAILAGTGIETSVAFRLRRRDVQVDAKTIVAAGTKNYNRRRVAKVATWAWKYVLEAIEGKAPDALLFDEINQHTVRDRHVDACMALAARGYQSFVVCNGKLKRYTLRDQRHTWAVYAVRGGWPIHAVSKQLGHANGVLALTTYGPFVPSDEERDRWESQAAIAAAAREKAIGVVPIGSKKAG